MASSSVGITRTSMTLRVYGRYKGVDVPPFPWINRPTYQQAISILHRVPR